jgi:hypothetical protein
MPKVSYRALKARKKICARRLSLHKQHSYIYIKTDMQEKKKVNVQNNNSTLSDLS